MSKLNKAFEGLAATKAALLTAAPGLSNLPSDVAGKTAEQMSHGASELASALFGGSAYVQYGHGRSEPGPTHEAEQEQAAEITTAHDHERDGMER